MPNKPNFPAVMATIRWEDFLEAEAAERDAADDGDAICESAAERQQDAQDRADEALDRYGNPRRYE